MRTKGPLYVGKLRYWHKKAFPVIEIGTTQEVEHPYRLGKCLVFRLPFTEPGYYIGLFYHNPKLGYDDDEQIDELMHKVMKGRTVWTPEDGMYDEFFKD